MSGAFSGAWDCHAHVFGPYARHPLAEGRSYTPPEAPAADYLALLARLGFTHGVLVHPSAYGTDHGLLLELLERHAHLRGVAVMRSGDAARIAGLRMRGVRAARFSQRAGTGANFAGSASFDDLLALAGALADQGLHAELWTDSATLPQLAPRIAALPVPVVIDHMGGFDAAAGMDDPGFQAMLRLLEGGNAWVKLCAYRNLPGMTMSDAGRPFHQRLVAANPEQVVWGTDWPHLRVTPRPEASRLLQWMVDWTGTAAQVRRILVDNPARLYA